VPVRIRFGPAGKPISMKSADILEAPAFLHSIGLDAMEYEAVRGVKIDEIKARMFGEEAHKNDIVLSLHAPYAINLASKNEATVKASIERLIDSVRAAHWMNAYIVVFHPGYYSGLDRREALECIITNLKSVTEIAKEVGVWLGVETTGRISQVGDLDEVIVISSKLERVKPIIDWAHLYARHGGTFIANIDDVIKVIERLEREVGEHSIRPLHSHFTKVEFNRSGEVRHRTLSERDYGPEFRYVCAGLIEVGVESVIISESPLLELDALAMKRVCLEMCSESCVVD